MRDIADVDIEELLEPVVTSSGGEAEERVLAFANVHVVTREEIVGRGLRSLAEVLQLVPGLYVVDDYVLPSIGVRGTTGGLRAGTRIVKVMINGVPVSFRPDLTAFIGPELIPMDVVERVEIVQGPLSALYGANAFIATINVITRTPDAGTHAAVGGVVQVVSNNPGYGAAGFVAAAGENRTFIAAVATGYTDRSGLRIGKTFAAQDPMLDRYRPLFAEPSRNDLATPTSAFMELTLGKEDKLGRLVVQGGAQRVDAIGDFQVNSAMTHRSRYALENYWSDVRGERRFSDTVFATANVGLSYGRPSRETRYYLTANDSSFFEPQFGYTALSGGASLTYSASERFSLRAGVDGEADSEEILWYRQTLQIPIGERRPGDVIDVNVSRKEDLTRLITQVGAGVQVTSVPAPDAAPGLRVAANVRADRLRYEDIDFDIEPSLRFGAVYQWSKKLVTKLIAGRAFQTPSGVLMFAKSGYGNANNVVGNFEVRSIGFAPLRPQKATGAELVTNVRPLPELNIGLGVYYQMIDDAIRFTPLATDFIAENQGTVRSTGALLDARLGLERFTVTATFTGVGHFEDGKLEFSPTERFPSFFGTVVTDVAITQAHLRAHARVRWATARGSTTSNTLLNNLTAYEVPGYAVVDAAAMSERLHLWSDDLETRLVASVSNILDARYHEPGFAGFDIPNLGRSFWLEVRQSF